METVTFAELFDKGVVAGCFIFGFILLLWKGIPGLMALLERVLLNINTAHTDQITTITEWFKEGLKDMGTLLAENINRNHAENLRLHDETRKTLEELLVVKKRKKNA